MVPRKNLSGTMLLKIFIDLADQHGMKYRPLIPWDEINLKNLKDYYTVIEIENAMEYYFGMKTSGWNVHQFIQELQTIVGRMDSDRIAKEERHRLMLETKRRMKEAGVDQP